MSVTTGNSTLQFISSVPFTAHPWAISYNHSSWVAEDPEILVRSFGRTPLYAVEDWEVEDGGLYEPLDSDETAATIGGYAVGFRGCRTLFPNSYVSVYQLGGPWNNLTITDAALRNVAQCLTGVVTRGVLPVIVSCYIDQDWSEPFISQIIGCACSSLTKTVNALSGRGASVSGVLPVGTKVRSIYMFSDSDGFGTPVFSLTEDRMRQILGLGLAAGAQEFILWNGAEYRLWVMSVTAAGPARAAMVSDFLNAHSLLLTYGTSTQQAAFAAAMLSSSSLEELWTLYAAFVDPFLFACANWAQGR